MFSGAGESAAKAIRGLEREIDGVVAAGEDIPLGSRIIAVCDAFTR